MILVPDSPRDPASIPAPSPARSRDPAFVAGAAAAFLLLCLLSEAGSRLAARTGFWYRRLDFAGTVTSLPELEERIHWASRQPRPAFLLGDSVLGASALIEHGARSARQMTLAAQMRDREARRGGHAESLAADGMLLTDIEAVARLLPSRAGVPKRALLLLNVRMFAPEFEDPKKAFSRDFLVAALPAGSPAGAAPLERTLPDRAFEHSSLLRSTAMLKSLWYFPTRRDFFRRAAERLLGPDSDPELAEAALRLRVARYYRSRWSSSSRAFASLGRALNKLSDASRAAVVLTPQNPEFVEDPEMLRTNRALLESFVRERAPGLVYRDWGGRFGADRFLDHCHLTADGNRELAGELDRLIEE